MPRSSWPTDNSILYEIWYIHPHTGKETIYDRTKTFAEAEALIDSMSYEDQQGATIEPPIHLT